MTWKGQKAGNTKEVTKFIREYWTEMWAHQQGEEAAEERRKIGKRMATEYEVVAEEVAAVEWHSPTEEEVWKVWKRLTVAVLRMDAMVSRYPDFHGVAANCFEP